MATTPCTVPAPNFTFALASSAPNFAPVITRPLSAKELAAEVKAAGGILFLDEMYNGMEW